MNNPEADALAEALADLLGAAETHLKTGFSTWLSLERSIHRGRATLERYRSQPQTPEAVPAETVAEIELPSTAKALVRLQYPNACAVYTGTGARGNQLYRIQNNRTTVDAVALSGTCQSEEAAWKAALKNLDKEKKRD